MRKMFKDRIHAGTQLAEKLLKFKNEDVVVLAIPRGGMPIGAIVTKALNAPLDVVLTKKIGHPNHKEYAIGAVSLEDMIVTNAFGVDPAYMEEEVVSIRKKLRQGYEHYYKYRSPKNITDKTVIIVDDGIATGNTLLATVELVSKQKPKKIVVAIPVSPSAAIHKLDTHPNVDEVICSLVPNNFEAVGQFYENFEQVSHQEAIDILEAFGS